MNWHNILMSFLEYCTLLPCAMTFSVPLLGHFRYPQKRIFTLEGITIILLSAVFSLLREWGFWLDINLYLIVCGVLITLPCFFITEIPWYKLTYVFLNTAAFFSFPGLMGYLSEACFRPEGNAHLPPTYGLAVKWLIIALLLLGCGFWGQKYRWLISEYGEKRVWPWMWTAPAAILLCNLMMIPGSYAPLHFGHTLPLYFFMELTLLLLLLLFNLMFYRIARTGVDRYVFEQQSYMIAAMESQYRKSKAYLEKTARLRHDFRQTVHTLSALAEAGKLAEIQNYLRTYEGALSERPPQAFCENAAINAILNYYDDLADANGVRTSLSLSLDGPWTLPEISLCSIFGNLLENAVHACQVLPPEKRTLALSAQIMGDGVLYITSTNAFDGSCRIQDGQFASTKPQGSGIGLKSIRAVAAQHSGNMHAYVKGDTFCVDVMLHLSSELPQ